jgi:multicomponent Na+:H+ antiporter subunit F
MMNAAYELVPRISAALIVVLMLPLAATIWRMIVGRTIIDRVIALDMLTGVAVALAGLVAVKLGRREFLDVAFGVALINFVGTVALSGFIEKKGRRKP